MVSSAKFLGSGMKCENHQKENIAYVTLNPVADYVYIAYLILELRVG